MNKAKISEVFQSIQGEGYYIGVRQVFVRFFECQMNCAWCDTPEAIGDTQQQYEEYTSDELWRKISALWSNCHSISFTGGEPLLQKDFIRAFLPRLKAAWITSYLETNGTLYQELDDVIDDIDIIAMDIKLPSSTQDRPYWDEHREFLKLAHQRDVFIKTVISMATTREDVLRSIDLVARVDPDIPYVLQPNFFDHESGVMQKCLDYHQECSKRLKNVRIIPQVHKFMKLR